MSILLAVTGWNPQHWLDALKAAAPGRTVVQPGVAFDPRSVRYALVWKPQAGYL